MNDTDTDKLTALTDVATRVVNAPCDRDMYAAIREMGELLRAQAEPALEPAAADAEELEQPPA